MNRISCHTGVMEKTRQTGVNRPAREYLARLAEERRRKSLARVRLRKALESGLVYVGDREWSRDDLYDR